MIFAIDLNPVDDIIDGVGGLIGGAAEAAGEAVIDLVVKFTFGLIADAVASVTGSIVSAMDSTTAVDLNGGFFPALTPIRQTVPGMSVALVLALFLVSIIRSPAAGEPGAIIRSALRRCALGHAPHGHVRRGCLDLDPHRRRGIARRDWRCRCGDGGVHGIARGS